MQAQVGRTVEVLVSQGRGEGHRRPADRTGPRQPPRAPGRRRRRTTGRPGRDRRDPGGPALPGGRRRAAVAPPHRRGRRLGGRPHAPARPASASACRASACPRRCPAPACA
jgi:hypothetical protein